MLFFSGSFRVQAPLTKTTYLFFCSETPVHPPPPNPSVKATQELSEGSALHVLRQGLAPEARNRQKGGEDVAQLLGLRLTAWINWLRWSKIG